MDGGMVHIRDEGWKEFKVGTVFDIDLRLERDPRTRDLVERAHGKHMAYSLDHYKLYVPTLENEFGRAGGHLAAVETRHR